MGVRGQPEITIANSICNNIILHCNSILLQLLHLTPYFNLTPLEHPDFRGQDIKDWKLTREAKENYQAALEQFLGTQSKKRKPIPKLMKKRLANKWSLCAPDGALKASVGVGLSVLVDEIPVQALNVW